MRHRTALSPLVAVGILLLVSGCQPAEEPAGEMDAMAGEEQPMEMDMASVREGIDAANRAFAESFNAGDIAMAAENVYTEDAVILPPGAPRIEGRQEIADFWTSAAEQMGIQSVDLTTVSVESLGPDMAYEIGQYTLTTGQGAQEGKYVVIWQRDPQGDWRWHVDMWNPSS